MTIVYSKIEIKVVQTNALYYTEVFDMYIHTHTHISSGFLDVL